MATTNTILRTVYPLYPKPRPRKDSRPMRVLCLGLPRSGTDSLRTAMSMLGYEEILHGFTIVASRSDQCEVWCRLLDAKLLTTTQSDGDEKGTTREATEFLRTFDWDSILGDCDVIMDMPAAVFWRELLEFYPDAKVIVSKRDLNKWHESLTSAARDVLEGAQGWVFWWLSLFDSGLFWWYRMAAVRCMRDIMGEGVGFEARGLSWGTRHYEELESFLEARDVERKKQGRGDRAKGYLCWQPTQGWDGLLDYLEADKPDGVTEFPWKNKGGQEFKAAADRAAMKLMLRAARNMIVILAVVVGGVSWALRS